MSEPKINKFMTIGEVVQNFPATEPVFMKYFGSGCFTCPGSKTEDIAFGASMHGIEADDIVKELNEAVDAVE